MAEVLPANVPPAEAVEYFRRKGYRPSFDWEEVYGAEHARVFTVAKAMELDLLRDLREAVDAAIADGATLEEFRRGLTPKLQERGWWGRKTVVDPATGEERTVQLGSPRRLATIYDTNLRTAHAAGKWEQIQRTKARRPYLRMVGILDERQRPLHRQWHGTVLPVDDPWWLTHYPPNGWRCRCSVQQLSERDLKRYGYSANPAAPESPPVAWQNPRTGELRRVPRGIDPGFDHNAGVAGQAHARSLLAEKLESAAREAPELARAAVRDLVGSEDFSRFLERPEGDFPVMVVPDLVGDAIGARRRVAVLSTDSLAKNRKHHPEVGADAYRRLPAAGDDPVLVVQDGPRSVVLVHQEDRALWVVVKATRSGEGLFVTSVRRTDTPDLEALRRRKGAKILLDGRRDSEEEGG